MKNKRFGAAFVILGGLLMISLILNICIGSVNVPLKDIPGIFLKTGANETYRDIVLNIRFPRALAAAIRRPRQISGWMAITARSPDWRCTPFPMT